MSQNFPLRPSAVWARHTVFPVHQWVGGGGFHLAALGEDAVNPHAQVWARTFSGRWGRSRGGDLLGRASPFDLARNRLTVDVLPSSACGRDRVLLSLGPDGGFSEGFGAPSARNAVSLPFPPRPPLFFPSPLFWAPWCFAPSRLVSGRGVCVSSVPCT